MANTIQVQYPHYNDVTEAWEWHMWVTYPPTGQIIALRYADDAWEPTTMNPSQTPEDKWLAYYTAVAGDGRDHLDVFNVPQAEEHRAEYMLGHDTESIFIWFVRIDDGVWQDPRTAPAPARKPWLKYITSGTDFPVRLSFRSQITTIQEFKEAYEQRFGPMFYRDGWLIVTYTADIERTQLAIRTEAATLAQATLDALTEPEPDPEVI